MEALAKALCGVEPGEELSREAMDAAREKNSERFVTAAKQLGLKVITREELGQRAAIARVELSKNIS